MIKRALIGLILFALVLGGVWVWRGRGVSAEAPTSSVVASLSAPAADGFAKATEANNIEFPRDLGPHNDYQTEWWYYTGNLASETGREFGFQFTIFRRALELPQPNAENDSNWRTDQVYLVHFTVSDIENGAFYHSERYSRGGAGLSGAQASPYRVWVDDWSVDELADGTIQMSASGAQSSEGEPYALNLNLTQTMAPVLHGKGGLSAKSLEAGNASYYYSLIQQQAVGTVQVGDETIEVRGKAWKDHEYSTSVLSEGALGWDWFSLQFDDGSALMLFEIRKAGGQVEAASSGTFVYPDGRTVDLALGDWELAVDRRWKSPNTDGNYPVAWQLEIPEVKLSIGGEAKMDNQELTLTTGAYWEGAVEFEGVREGAAISAEGYIEMTGYGD
ncbi:MAG: lipocalin-like domain-containing protein [Candidatus Promineifilaceae bacterium]